MIYNHYANRKGLSVPNIAARAQRLRPEGGPNASHASTFDQLGFGTPLYQAARRWRLSRTARRKHFGLHVSFHGTPCRQSDDGIRTASGSNIERRTLNGDPSQQWNVAHLGGGQYTIQNEKSGLYLQISNASLDHGASFQLANRNSGDHQRFVFIPSVTGTTGSRPSQATNPRTLKISLRRTERLSSNGGIS